MEEGKSQTPLFATGNCTLFHPKTGLTMKAMKGVFLFVLVGLGLSVLAMNDAHAQGTITGVVTEADTGLPLPTATVHIIGTQLGTTSDLEGRYTISGLTAGRYSIRVSFVGFAPSTSAVTLAAGETVELNFVMATAEVGLEEVTVVGYGVQRREDVTGSVGIIDTENIEAVPLTSVDQALQGQIAGVTVQHATGAPGAGPQIQVRGTGNLGAGGQPLYVVDGFALPQPNQADDGNNITLTRNPLADIPAEDIQSISVLKDASATAIYGSRASNGVVIITTKSGSAGPLEINVSAYSGLHSPMDRMTINAATPYEFALFQNRIWAGRVADGSASSIPEQYRNPDDFRSLTTNWWDEIHRTAQQHNVQIAISGGTSNLRSYFSGGVTRQEGQVRDTDFTRMSLRANLEANLSQNLTAGLRVAPTFSIRNLGYEGGIGRGADGDPGGGPWMMCPLAEVYLPDGSLNPQIGAAPGFECPGVWSHANPILWLQEDVDRDETLRALTSAFVNYEILPGLSVRQSFNVDYGSGEREEFIPSIIGRRRRPPPRVPTGRFRSNSHLNWLSESTVNLSTPLGPGRLDALAGFTAQTEEVLRSDFSGTFPGDDIRTLNVASNLQGQTSEASWSLLSGLARINYNFRDRFVLTGTVRADGSSRFGSANRWGTFPSGAVAWNLHNESFMEGLRLKVPELRARFSYGETGNNQIGNYSSLGVIGDSDYVLGGNTAAGRILGTLGNTALGWEKTEEFNFGVDASLHNYRLRLSLELYQRNTNQLLLNRELPRTSGFASVTENLGEIRNQGLEFSLHSANVTRDDFSWRTDFNIAFNRNEVTTLPGGNDIRYGGEGPAEFIHRVGLPMSTYVGYLVDGVYSQAQLAGITGYAGAIPGTIIFRDLQNDGVISERVMQSAGGDFAVLGDAYPDFTFGMTHTVSLGQVDVRALFTGAFGGNNLRSEFFRTARNIDGLFIVDSDYVQNMYVSPQEPGDGLTPSPLGGAFGRQQYRDNNHSLMISDASFIWMRNLMVRYNFRGGPLAGSSLYLSGDNLLIFSPYDGNPDVTDMETANTQPGLDFGNYPIPRSFTVGIELSL